MQLPTKVNISVADFRNSTLGIIHSLISVVRTLHAHCACAPYVCIARARLTLHARVLSEFITTCGLARCLFRAYN